MFTYDYLNESNYLIIKNTPINLNTKKLKYIHLFPYFIQNIKHIIIKKYGFNNTYKSGLYIYSSLDSSLQIIAQNSLYFGLKKLDKRYGYQKDINVYSLFNNIYSYHHLHILRYFLFIQNTNTFWNLNKYKYKTAISLKNKQIKNYLISRITLISSVYHLIFLDFGHNYGVLSFKYSLLSFNNMNNLFYSLNIGNYIEVNINNKHIKSYSNLTQNICVQGCIISIASKYNQILSLVGGINYHLSNFNRATQAKRQPGSSIKPFIYASAFDSKKMTPSSIISDIPKKYINKLSKNIWKPKNHTKKYLGDITIRTCLLSSVNICSIHIIEKLGYNKIINLTKQLNLNNKKTPFAKNLTIALGSPEVIPLKFVNAYSIFPNLGLFSQEIFINHIKDSKKNTLFHNTILSRQVLSQESTFLVTNILKRFVHKKYLFKYTKYFAAGKTGTSNDWTNAWFVGYTSDIITGVYIGFDDNSSLGVAEYGIRNAMPIWFSFMKQTLKDIPIHDFKQPSNITWRFTNKKNGNLSLKYNKYKNNVLEAFISGTEKNLSFTSHQNSSLELFESSINFK